MGGKAVFAVIRHGQRAAALGLGADIAEGIIDIIGIAPWAGSRDEAAQIIVSIGAVIAANGVVDRTRDLSTPIIGIGHINRLHTGFLRQHPQWQLSCVQCLAVNLPIAVSHAGD